MNDKLRQFVGKRCNDITPCRKSYNGTPRDELIMIRCRNRAKAEQRGHKEMRFSLHSRLLKKAGWMFGDKVDYEVIETGFVLFRSDTGRTISKSGGKNSGCNRGYLCYSITDDFWSAINGCKEAAVNVECEDGRIAFDVAW